MLSDTDIRQEIEKRKTSQNDGIAIDPFDDRSLTPVGYDLRVGAKGFSWKSKRSFDIRNDGSIKVDPYDTVIIETAESVTLSQELSGTIQSMVSKVIPKGLSHISTTVDPGWTGKLLISVHNFYDIPTELRFQERLCTICFYNVTTKATRGVGSQPDREDLWDQLLEKSNDKRREDAKKRREGIKQNIVLIIIAILLLVSGFYVSSQDPVMGASLAAFLAILIPVVLELLRQSKA